MVERRGVTRRGDREHRRGGYRARLRLEYRWVLLLLVFCAAPTLAEAPASQRGVFVFVGAGAAIPSGRTSNGFDAVNLDDRIAASRSLVLSGGYRLSGAWSAGIELNADALTREPLCVQETCGDGRMSGTVFGRHHFPIRMGSGSVFVGVGAGWDRLWDTNRFESESGPVRVTEAWEGPILRMTGGAEFRIGPLVTGPFASATVGQFLVASASSRVRSNAQLIGYPSVYAWTGVGVFAEWGAFDRPAPPPKPVSHIAGDRLDTATDALGSMEGLIRSGRWGLVLQRATIVRKQIVFARSVLGGEEWVQVVMTETMGPVGRVELDEALARLEHEARRLEEAASAALRESESPASSP